MRKTVSFFLIFLMIIGFTTPITTAHASQVNRAGRSASSALLPAPASWESAMNRSLDWIQSTVSPNPVVGSVGGEWAVLALARANRVTADDPWIRAWLADLDRTLAEVDRLAVNNDIQNPTSAGTFPSALRRWTDFQRVTIAVSALGLDASDYNGRNLTEIFSSYVPSAERHPLNQTINVDTFALIALDARHYKGDRDRFIQSLIDAQRDDGTWSLSPNSPSSSFDLDVTAMALQALAPYYYRNDVRVANAVDMALGWLRAQTFPDVESTAQMIVALTALGSNFADEAEYYVIHLLRWFDPATGGFRRLTPNDPVNLMATEQAAYALVAYWRFLNNIKPLYDMSDAFGGVRVTTEAPAETAPTETFGLPNRHADVRRIEITLPNRTFIDIQSHESRAAIEALATRDIISGRNENEFDLYATMTRAEFAAIVTRSLGLPAKPNAHFSDVPPNAWFAGAVGITFYYEIISGVTPTTFNPNGTITRQEAAVMVTRAARLAGMDTNLGDTEILNILAMFGDYRTAAGWARSSLAFCFREDILDDSGFYIEPLEEITRGEIAGMLYQMLRRANLT